MSVDAGFGAFGDPEDFGSQQGIQPDNSPAGLRAALDKANARAKALEKQNQELQASNRATNLSLALTANGVDPKRFAQYVPADLAVTDDAVKAWVKDNAGVFNFGTVEPQAQQTQTEQTQQQPQAQQQQTQEPVKVDPLAVVDGKFPGLIDALQGLGVIADRSQAASGAERAQLAEQLAAAAPKSLDDAKAMLAGLGIELQDTGGYRF
jgi:hypothetical protein